MASLLAGICKPEPITAFLNDRSTHPVERLSFYDWLKQVSPNDNWDWPHLAYIRTYLDAITAGTLKRLIVTVPPRHGKSHLGTIRYPVYRLEQDPTQRVVIAAYSQTLANTFSRQARRIASERMNIASDRKAVEQWETASGGGLRAVGVGGGITGLGANCLPAGTMVQTRRGSVPIEQINVGAKPDKILSYNSGRLEYKEAQAIQVREGAWLYRITTASGRVVEATGNHRFYVAGDYREASSLATGELLMLLVPADRGQGGLRLQEVGGKRSQGHLLQPALLGSSPRDQELSSLCLRGSQEAQSQVLRCLPARVEAKTPASASACDQVLSRVQLRVQSILEGRRKRIRNLLRHGLQEQGALKADEWQAKPQVEAWGNAIACAASFGQGVQDHARVGQKKRRVCLRELQGHRLSACSSHRQLAHEQPRNQLGNALPNLSFQVAQGSGFQAIYEPIAMVERLCRQATVYDIQVKDNHNFFANGLLCHNCIIIDDPVKSREEAESEAYRERVWNWYRDDLYTRLEPGGAVVLTMTRWHEDDLAGRILGSDDADSWTVVNLPAIAEDNDPLGRTPGAALCPERYDIDALQDRRRVLGEYGFNALFQQRPSPPAGGLFKRSWWQTYRELPQLDRIITSWDLTFKDGPNTDYVVGLVIGQKGASFYLLDCIRDRLDITETIPAIVNTFNRYKPVATVVEDKANGPAVIAMLKSKVAGLIAVNPQGGKFSRASAISPMIEAGNVFLPERSTWASALIEEAAAFPNAAHDDQVDALSQGLSWLRSRPAISTAAAVSYGQAAAW